MISRDYEISTFESYTLLRLIENENQLDVGIQFLSLGLIFVLTKNNFFFHINRTAEPDQSILIMMYNLFRDAHVRSLIRHTYFMRLSKNCGLFSSEHSTIK